MIGPVKINRVNTKTAHFSHLLYHNLIANYLHYNTAIMCSTDAEFDGNYPEIYRNRIHYIQS